MAVSCALLKVDGVDVSGFAVEVSPDELQAGGVRLQTRHRSRQEDRAFEHEYRQLQLRCRLLFHRSQT